MAFEANLVSEPQRYRVRTAAETERAFVSAGRHSRAVAILRKGLPVVAATVLAGYFISSSFSVNVGDMSASIDGIQVSDGNLRMTNPKLRGSDKKNGSYVIGADYADQDIKNPKIVKLHALHADVTSPSGGWSRMRATRGVFNTQTERLVMQDNITVATSNGLSGELANASLDMQSHKLRSHMPVSFTLPNGTVRASALTLDSSSHTITFRGKVRVHIDKKDATADGKAEAAKPKPEAHDATQSATPQAAPPMAEIAAPEPPASVEVPPLPPAGAAQ